MSFRIRSSDGHNLLCTYKANPDDTLPTVGFMGEAALELIQPSLVVSFTSKRAAQRCADIYGGTVDEFGNAPDLDASLTRVLNGGW